MFYYLNSRYYNPNWCRFINADDVDYIDASGTVLGCNLFSYCENNPVNNVDPYGKIAVTTCVLIGIGIGIVIGGAAGYGIAKYFNVPKKKTWKYVLGGAIIGGAIGGCIGYSLGTVAGSGAVLWSGKGMEQAAKSFATKNGLKTIGQTLKGRLLNVIDKSLKAVLKPARAKVIMKPLWDAASSRFVVSYASKAEFIHIFITAQAYSDINSTFNRIEYNVISELGLKIIWHFVN